MEPSQNPSTQEQKPDASTTPESLVGRRIEYQGDYGIVKYHGPLMHKDESQDPNQVWLGIQWDNPTRGRHNGTVQGIQYFISDNGDTAGSLLKVDKANFGITIYDGILLRYFPNPVSHETQQAQSTQPASTDNTAGTAAPVGETEKAEEGSFVNEKGVKVEFDTEAYFETVRKFKKKVEFLGFDKIWKKINDLKNLKELSLPDCKISDIGPDGSLQKLLPSVKNLSLEANLLYDWNQVFLIGRELKHLEQLAISSHVLPPVETDVRDLKRIYVNSNDTFIHEPPINVFTNLQTIIMISMGLTWKSLNNLLPMLLHIENLVVCKNQLNDFENLTYNGSDFKKLKFLNLECNGFKTFEGASVFKNAPLLEKLTLSQNNLKELGPVTGFENLVSLTMEECDISDFYIFSQMNRFPKLETIRITKNPISTKYNPLHIRQRAIAEIRNLKFINGSELKKYERKDCEIYYLRNTFQEYFEKSGQNAYEYDYNQFLAYCTSEHPRIQELIQMYGNPYDDSLKGEKKQADPSVANRAANFVNVKLNAFTGPGLGKPAVTKKLTANTTITNLKAMLAKQFGIPATKQKVYYKADRDDPFTALDEDLKDLAYYGVRNEGEIWVGDQEM